MGIELKNPANSNIFHRDIVLPFQLEDLNVQGRFVRLSLALSRILHQHDYPLPVSRLLGEALLLVSLIGSGLKLKNKLTLQISGDGAIKTLIADYYHDGSIRGYATFDKEMLDRWTGENEEFNPFLLLGKGYCALTIDHGEGMAPYQGVVELSGQSLSRAILIYLEESDQIMSSLRLHLHHEKDIHTEGNKKGIWHGGAFLIQKLGKSGNNARVIASSEEDEENWNTACILSRTLTDAELIDDSTPMERVVYNIYNAYQIKVFLEIPIQFGCTCSKDRLFNLLKQYEISILEEMSVNGIVSADCQFCATQYHFTLPELE